MAERLQGEENEKKQLVKVYDVTKSQEKDYWIYLSAKVSDLKKRIYKKGFRVKVESQKLWYQGKVLEDGMKLVDCGIKSGGEV